MEIVVVVVVVIVVGVLEAGADIGVSGDRGP